MVQIAPLQFFYKDSFGYFLCEYPKVQVFKQLEISPYYTMVALDRALSMS